MYTLIYINVIYIYVYMDCLSLHIGLENLILLILQYIYMYLSVKPLAQEAPEDSKIRHQKHF